MKILNKNHQGQMTNIHGLKITFQTLKFPFLFHFIFTSNDQNLLLKSDIAVTKLENLPRHPKVEG
jgi:hypothetical protein